MQVISFSFPIINSLLLECDMIWFHYFTLCSNTHICLGFQPLKRDCTQILSTYSYFERYYVFDSSNNSSNATILPMPFVTAVIHMPFKLQTLIIYLFVLTYFKPMKLYCFESATDVTSKSNGAIYMCG